MLAIEEPTEVATQPKVLVFSTATISDIGIDLAGSTHLHYSPSVVAISVSCSSGIRPEWIVHALEHGFDGVFVAADGTDCPFLADCTDRTGRVTAVAQDMMKARGISPERLKMAAICSVCAEPFVRHMDQFSRALMALESMGEDD